MAETVGQVWQAIEVARMKIYQLKFQLENEKLVPTQVKSLEDQITFQRKMLGLWGAKYKKMVGGADAFFFNADELESDLAFPIDQLKAKSKTPEELAKEAQDRLKAGLAEAEKNDFAEKVSLVRNSTSTLTGACWEFLAALERDTNPSTSPAELLRVGGGLGGALAGYAIDPNADRSSFFGTLGQLGGASSHLLSWQDPRTPANIANRASTSVDILVRKAETLFAQGKKEEALAQLRMAANTLIDESTKFDAYSDMVMVGGERSQTSFKVAAAVGTAFATGGRSLTVGQGTFASGLSEGSTQSSLLILEQLDGKSQVSDEDVKKAVVATLVAAAGGGLGRGAGEKFKAAARVAEKGILPKLITFYQKKIGRNLTDEEIKYLSEVVRRWVEANFNETAKWVLSDSYDVNFWHMTVAPFLPAHLFKPTGKLGDTPDFGKVPDTPFVDSSSTAPPNDT